MGYFPIDTRARVGKLENHETVFKHDRQVAQNGKSEGGETRKPK